MKHEHGVIKLQDGDDLTFTKRSKRYMSTAPYDRLGKKGTTRYGVLGMDMLKILADSSAAAHWLFWSLAQVRNMRTNISMFRSADLTPTEKQKTSKGYKELHALDVIVRTKQNHYLINPRALLPENGDFINICTNWDELTQPTQEK